MKTKGKFVYKILIDSSKRYEKAITLVKDGQKVDEVTGDLDIAVAIQQLLEKNSLEPFDIKEFEANPGPGSFTGLKIGVTIANVLNWALGKKKSSELAYPEYGSEPNIHKTKWLEK